MSAPEPLVFGTQGSYGDQPPKPTITGTDPVLIVVKIAWFYAFGVPTLTGGVGTFTLAGAYTSEPDGAAASAAVFYKALAAADIATENAASYTFTPPAGGGDFLCFVEVWEGHDTTTPVPVGGVEHAEHPISGSTPLVVPAPTISRADSVTTVGCGAWDFNVWTDVPTGYTRSVAWSGLEAAQYYDDAPQSTGSSITFTNATQRVVSIVIVIQPPAAPPPASEDNALFFGAGTTN